MKPPLALRNPKTSTDRVMVVIPSFNEGSNLVRAVQRVRSELPESYLLVIDDSDREESVGLLTSLPAEVIHRFPRAGQASAYNLAARQFLGTDIAWLLFMEADLELAEGILTEALTASQGFDVCSQVCYPSEPTDDGHYSWANFLKMRIWIEARQRTGPVPSRIILLNRKSASAIFPIAAGFLDPTSWIVGRAQELGLRQATSMAVGATFHVPTTRDESLREIARTWYSSNQISGRFPHQALSPCAVLIAVANTLIRVRLPLASWWWLGRLVLAHPDYSEGTLWSANESTKRTLGRQET